MQKRKVFEKVPGVIVAIIVGLFVYRIAAFHKAMDALVVGIVLGMAIRTCIGERSYLLPGLSFAPKFFIPLGIILYGVNLKFHKLAGIPAVFWLQFTVGIILIFLIAVYLGRRLGAKDETSFLIAVGTAICGASAIAIATPVVKADSEDAASSLITITIFGLFGMFIYPLLLTYVSFPKTEYALLCATTLHMTGLVKTASLALGESCMKLALSIKMARTALIIPVVAFLCWYIRRKEAKKQRPILLQIPWYMWTFVFVGLLTSFLPGFNLLGETLKPWAGLFFTMALTSIGLTVDLKKMLNVGGAPLMVGLGCWLTAIGVFILGNYIF